MAPCRVDPPRCLAPRLEMLQRWRCARLDQPTRQSVPAPTMPGAFWRHPIMSGEEGLYALWTLLPSPTCCPFFSAILFQVWPINRRIPNFFASISLTRFFWSSLHCVIPMTSPLHGFPIKCYLGSPTTVSVLKTEAKRKVSGNRTNIKFPQPEATDIFNQRQYLWKVLRNRETKKPFDNGGPYYFHNIFL